MRRLLSICLFALSAFVVAAQQPQAPTSSDAHQSSSTIRVQTEVVIEEVTVKDKNGNPIPNLKASDFVLTEDGVPQTISFVEYQEIAPLASAPQPPPAANTAVPTAPPVTSFQIAPEAPGDTKYHNHRLVALYFDRSTMGPPDQLRALEAALDFINKQMDPSVMMAVMTYDGTAVRVIQDFTGDRAQVVAAVNKLIVALSEGLDESSNDDSAADTGSSFGQDDAEFNLFNTDRQLAALETAVKMLGSINEQKALVYFASGLASQRPRQPSAAGRHRKRLLALQRDALPDRRPRPRRHGARRRRHARLEWRHRHVFNGSGAQALVNRFQQSQDTLYAIAKDTGGKAFLDSNDLALGIKQAANSITSYYEIGYYPKRTVKDGRFRRIKVSLRAGIDGELSYRQGYYADKEFAKFNATDKERQLEDALMLDNPITEINLAMEVDYFQLNSAEYFVSVDVKIPGRELALAKKGGAKETLMDMIGEVKDDFGNTIQNLRDKLNIKMDQETAAQLATHPIEYHTGFTLLPGKYSIKYLVRDNETGRIGTYQLPFNIPNLNKQLKELPISSVVLSGQREAVSDSIYNVKQKIDATNVDPLVLDGEKLIPSVTRVFSKARDLYVYVQAYEHADPTPVPIVAYVGLYQGQTKVFQSAPLAVVEQTQNRAKAVPIRFDLPLDKIAPGAYDCQVTVIDPSSQKAAFWQGRIVVIQ